MKQYNNTDQHLHFLCQVIAKANRSFVPKNRDDSHTNLYFDSLGNRITGRWIKVKNEKFICSLNLANLHYEISNDAQKVFASIPSIGSTMDEIEEKIEKSLSELGLKTRDFREKLHFKISEYDFIKAPVAAIESVALAEWKEMRELANEACFHLLGHLQNKEEIRIWPHHFDTGIYTIINSNIGLGFGLAMQDEMVGEPYFYMSGNSLDSTINYIDLPSDKDWRWEIGKKWNGAVLSLNQLFDKTEDEQKAILRNFIINAYAWYAKQ